MESTGVYGKPVGNILEGQFAVLLVNAQHIKAVPGRKTDQNDAEWIADLLQHGLLRSSFVPPTPIRELRDLTRYGVSLVQECNRIANRIQKVLMALRRRGDQWRLLAASTDPASNTSFVNQLPALVSLITKPGTPGSSPEPASLLTPQGGEFPVPASGTRFGDFSWHPSPSAGDVAEFAYNGDARLFAIFFSGPAPATEHYSAGLLWSSGGKWTWRWRVWSISDIGAVSFSQARSFTN